MSKKHVRNLAMPLQSCVVKLPMSPGTESGRWRNIIYHLVGRLYHPSVPTELYRQTHVEGTRILLNACKGQSQLQRIVHCSTTGVLGVTGKKPAAEDAPFAPTNPYEATKLEGELLALRAYKEYGLPVSVIRPGLVYGPGDLHLLGFFSSIKKDDPV